MEEHKGYTLMSREIFLDSKCTLHSLVELNTSEMNWSSFGNIFFSLTKLPEPTTKQPGMTFTLARNTVSNKYLYLTCI